MSKILIPLFTALLLSTCALNGETGSSSNGGHVETPADQKTKTLAIGLTSEASIDKSTLLASIKDGGYIIYFRHTTTERDYADQADPLMSLDDCSSQRMLSTQGIEESYESGMTFASKESQSVKLLLVNSGGHGKQQTSHLENIPKKIHG